MVSDSGAFCAAAIFPNFYPRTGIAYLYRNFYTRERETKTFLEKVSNGRKKTWQTVTARR